MGLRVALGGAVGKMGLAMAGFLLDDPELELAAAVDGEHTGADVGVLAGGPPCGVRIAGDLAEALDRAAPQVLLELSEPEAVKPGLLAAVHRGLPGVAGAAGLSEDDLAELDAAARAHDTGLILVPNFALAAVLLSRFAAEAVKYFPDCELIEAHHDRKPDAPSGTALYLARSLAASRPAPADSGGEGRPSAAGCRGGAEQGIRLHSVRLPGTLARHELIVGGPGQMLTIRQECSDRRCFWPGVRLALLKAGQVRGLQLGLEDFI